MEQCVSNCKCNVNFGRFRKPESLGTFTILSYKDISNSNIDCATTYQIPSDVTKQHQMDLKTIFFQKGTTDQMLFASISYIFLIRSIY
jgi:hypothetical protein